MMTPSIHMMLLAYPVTYDVSEYAIAHTTASACVVREPCAPAAAKRLRRNTRQVTAVSGIFTANRKLKKYGTSAGSQKATSRFIGLDR